MLELAEEEIAVVCAQEIEAGIGVRGNDRQTVRRCRSFKGLSLLITASAVNASHETLMMVSSIWEADAISGIANADPC